VTRAEQLMGEIVDLLAADPGQEVDPRAWAQLLIYVPTKQDAPALARVVHAVVVASRNLAIETCVAACAMFDEPGARKCVAALRDLKRMMNPGEGETRQ